MTGLLPYDNDMKTEYRGYKIDRSGFNYSVYKANGERAWAELAATRDTAKKWIDQAIAETNTKQDMRKTSIRRLVEHKVSLVTGATLTQLGSESWKLAYRGSSWIGSLFMIENLVDALRTWASES